METIRRLRAEAQATNERRLVVLTGNPESTRDRAEAALAATQIDPAETTYVGPSDSFHCESLAHHEGSALLGTSREAVIYDCWDRCEPNMLGKLVGSVVGGGLFIILTPPLSEWPDRADAFDESLAIPPFDVSSVGNRFRRRIVQTLREHRGIAIIDAETGTVIKNGRCEKAPSRPRQPPDPPTEHMFPASAYGACKTQDQVDVLHTLEALQKDDTAVVVEADRGRGKSSAAGLAAASLAIDGQDVLVTAPTTTSVVSFFNRARELLAQREEYDFFSESKRVIQTESGQIRYKTPATAAELPGEPDTVFVDEAAAIPVRLLESLLEARAVAFTTTVRGYEGTGRGFAVRFRERLTESRFAVTERQMTEPIRYAGGDPIEVWLFRALALDARPPVPQLISDATPETVTYRQFSGETLLADEQLLRELFGLLVLAHYRTDPNDLARLLDAPNVSVHALTVDGHVASVALCAHEGNLTKKQRREIYEGARIRGHLIPDVLTSQLRDEAAGTGTGMRVMRIATESSVRSRGLGSHLLNQIADHAREEALDWLGVSFGVTPELVEFWSKNGYCTVHLSTTRNDRSGAHSAVMIRPFSEDGTALLDRHTEWFLRRTPAAIRESLSDVAPELIRAVCESAAGAPELSLSDQEWRHVAGLSSGASVYQTAPRGVARLIFRHIVAPDKELLSSEHRRLLIRKALQGQSWETVTQDEGYPSEAQCKRALGAAVEPLVNCYGGAIAQEERKKYS